MSDSDERMYHDEDHPPPDKVTAEPGRHRAQAREWRKRPVVIQAIQWTGDNLKDVIEFTDHYRPTEDSIHAGRHWMDYEDLVRREGFKVKTLEGWLYASVGDYIIRGIKGELYPCKPDIFAATYEAVPAMTDAAPVRGDVRGARYAVEVNGE